MAIPRLHAQTEGRPALVYALVDPLNMEAFYVGVTTRAGSGRLGSHIFDARANPDRNERTKRLAGILASEKRPLLYDLETVQGPDWVEAEQFWIANLRFLGCQLTNQAIGGPGSTGSRQSATAKQRRKKAAAGRDMSHLHTPEMRELCASKLRGRRGRYWSEDDRKAQSARITGKSNGPHSTETKRKISQSHMGIRSGMLGRSHTAETREKMSASKRLRDLII